MSSSTPSTDMENGVEENTFKILLATDCHLGYEDSTSKNHRKDSFTTFEEILQLASRNNVDFILLGGDLFHDCKPPQNVILQCIKMIKQYCLGSRPINFQFLTDPESVLSSFPPKVNYEDPDINIAIPIFTIHGNHDNPSFEYTSTLDILVASGLINYFGKLPDLNKITIVPIILKKGNTHIAIYGISYIGEQRLSRLFDQERVVFLRPKNIENCVNILVIHQNRAKHTRNGHIPDDKLPGFFDIVFWGHEHECIVEPELIINGEDEYHIIQQGSSVATSICEGEAKAKHVGLLTIKGTSWNYKPIKLQTIRPLLYESIYIPEIINQEYCEPSPEGICEYVDDYIENTMFPQVKSYITGHPEQPQEPLIRVKLVYAEDSQKFDTMQLTRKYCDRVANPKDIIAFRKKKPTDSSNRMNFGGDAAAALAECFRQNEPDQDWTYAVQNGIQKFFETTDNKLRVLSVLGMNEALDRCIKTMDDDAFASILQHQIGKTINYFKGRTIQLNPEVYREEIIAYQRQRSADNAEDEIREVQTMLDDRDVREKLKESQLNNQIDYDNDEVIEIIPPTTKARGRGSRGGRGSRARKPPASRGRGEKNPLDITTVASTPKKAPSMSSTKITKAVQDRFTQPSIKRGNIRTSLIGIHASQSQRLSDSSDSD
ncbi:hypothetical protein PV328_000504 [Microctonus aethiopoides]|uniref:Double-strand break repair protein n=1 Tax=Microctonus aethiopoides TaxID=144406 RepID=A0AA39FW91_9HYME|nr:hypothetical protein PV328_000504 [Microctonus aethiopoides]